jgi:NAD(P)-dependent dehydrogenase (short-subunit alcohol dehydrogenase family)
MRLAGRTAIISGAGSGIGRAIATAFARDGAEVVVADVTETVREGGVPTVAAVAAEGGSGTFMPCDVSVAADVERVVSETAARFGRLDVFVNNAMVTGFAPVPLLDCSDEQWARTLAVNLTGTFHGCRAAVRQMRGQAPRGEVRGRIVNIASQLGIVAARGNCAYGVSKAGCAYLTRQVATDYAAEGIVVNAIAPGKVMTGKGGAAEEPEVVAFSRSRTPWPRLGAPADIAAAAVFLASDEARFIQGEILAVDGGWLAS